MVGVIFSASISIVARSTPLGSTSPLPEPMQESSASGTPTMKKTTNRARTAPWFSLPKVGSATPTSILVGPSGFPYLS